MKTDKLFEQTIESVLRLVGHHGFLPISELLQRPTQVFAFPNELSGYSFLSPDVIFRDDGKIVIEEVNGSNAASSGTLPDGVSKRARHMAQTLMARGLEKGCVCLLAHSPTFRLPSEFYTRAALFANCLAENFSVAIRHPDEELNGEDIAVVPGAISKLADHCVVDAGMLLFKGRKVAFAQNPNILPELVRRGKLTRFGNTYGVDCNVFHEGAPGVVAVHDRALQQTLTAGTGFTALKTVEAYSWEQAHHALAQFHQAGMHAVGKINAGSQGCGIRFFPAHRGMEVSQRLEELRNAANAKYSSTSESSLFPLRFFEFATARPYNIEGRGHLWNLRFETHVSPGTTEVIPNGMRLCPAAFDRQTFALEGVLSNVSGRDHGLKFVRAPFAQHASGSTELEWAGVSDSELEQAAAACALWAEAAIKE